MKPSLKTHYLGLDLRTPLVAGASPLADEIDNALRIEDAGAGAVVMHSLFEEQLRNDAEATAYHTEVHADSFAEATSYLPQPDDYTHGPDEYLEHLRRLKQRLGIPVIGSLNGITPGGWTGHAELIAQAGADALELNLYHMPVEGTRSGDEIERELLDTVREVRARIALPIAVKVSPFLTAPVHFARQLKAAGADSVVLFNRFYQPDINLELLETVPRLQLSNSSELLLRLRFTAAMWGRDDVPAVTLSGGVHQPEDLVKALMSGATVVQTVSAVLKHGPARIADLLDGLQTWMIDHEYTDVNELRGCMGLHNCPDPTAFERGNYMRILQGWKI